MNAKTTVMVLLLVTTLSASGGIELIPASSDYVANGCKIQQVSFKDGKRRIDYEPPSGWGIDGSASQLTLKPKANFAEGAIIVTPLIKPQPLDENSIKALGQLLLAKL